MRWASDQVILPSPSRRAQYFFNLVGGLGGRFGELLWSWGGGGDAYLPCFCADLCFLDVVVSLSVAGGV